VRTANSPRGSARLRFPHGGDARHGLQGRRQKFPYRHQLSRWEPTAPTSSTSVPRGVMGCPDGSSSPQKEAPHRGTQRGKLQASTSPITATNPTFFLWAVPGIMHQECLRSSARSGHGQHIFTSVSIPAMWAKPRAAARVVPTGEKKNNTVYTRSVAGTVSASTLGDAALRW